jgi:hypothetical protein
MQKPQQNTLAHLSPAFRFLASNAEVVAGVMPVVGMRPAWQSSAAAFVRRLRSVEAGGHKGAEKLGGGGGSRSVCGGGVARAW